MKIHITFGAAVLSLAAVVTSCATTTSPSPRNGSTYLVGVAGGG
jgi:hypothetical protein